MRTVIFDLDGTLADTSKDLLEAANACFRELGHDDPLTDADSAVAVRGGRAMLRLAFDRLGGPWDEGMVNREYPELLRHYETRIDTHTVLYPGAMEAVAELGRRGIGVGICTNKPEALAQLLLSRLGVRDAFGSLVGADTLAVRKPDPEALFVAAERAGGLRHRALLVGDTVTDRDTARAAGVPCALVTFGPGGRSVEELEPEALLERFEDLPDVAERLLGAA
ncbi:HAD-IA family hydrolase [Roseicyclus sp. F158]|uniref:phosphoglycolate phosphatase n=1 Tax=Tropicimonas omnivorans TaxID=3075590 RepID=A0ABU3DIV3_9RHOB|nr:HAD-IA family hydrolase [Roseicyclus sp. F158]MDT0683648.1 HAD-IA family hydrolase [Roseicyclus sp. F158]